MAIELNRYAISKAAGTVTLTGPDASGNYTATFAQWDPNTGVSIMPIVETDTLANIQPLLISAQSSVTLLTTLQTDMQTLSQQASPAPPS